MGSDVHNLTRATCLKGFAKTQLPEAAGTDEIKHIAEGSKQHFVTPDCPADTLL